MFCFIWGNGFSIIKLSIYITKVSQVNKYQLACL